MLYYHIRAAKRRSNNGKQRRVKAMTAGYIYTPKSGNLKIDLFFLLQGTYTMFSKALERRLFQERLTPTALEIMLLLKGQGAQSAYKVALTLGKEHHSVVEIANRMKAKDIIERNDRTIQLTSKGNDIADSILSRDALGDVLPSDKQLVESLFQLRDSLAKSLGCTNRGVVNLNLGSKKTKPKSK